MTASSSRHPGRWLLNAGATSAAETVHKKRSLPGFPTPWRCLTLNPASPMLVNHPREHGHELRWSVIMISQVLHLGDNDLARLIDGGEGARVEFKESFGGSAPQRIREAVCAFAQRSPWLRRNPALSWSALGDGGVHAGPYRLGRTASCLVGHTHRREHRTPRPFSWSKKRLHKNCEVAIIMVQPSDSPPVRYKGAIHVRSGPRRGVANAQDERVLNERRRYGNRPFDIAPLPGSDTTQLNRRQFEDEYLPKAV